MGTPSVINSKSVNTEPINESQLVKYKLHITLRFVTKTKGVKLAIAKVLRSCGLGEIESQQMTEVFREGTFKYEDMDEGEYIVKERTFTICENSPKALKRVSEDIDNYIFGFCIKPDVQEVAVALLIPLLNLYSIIPRVFLNAFPIKCLTTNSPMTYKINRGKCCVVYYGFNEIKAHPNSMPRTVAVHGNTDINALQVQMCALLSYYVYFFMDMYEQKNWSVFKKDISKKVNIRKKVSKKLSLKGDDVNLFWKALTFIPTVTIATLTKTLDFLCNYDGHLSNRIYNRIMDVIDIASNYCNEDDYVDKIYHILDESKDKPINPHLFFERCGYWKYLNNPVLENFCKDWHIYESEDSELAVDTGFFSGYGAVMFTNGKDYIYAFKGTDFDSYGKDWLLTNVLQGLTGFSIQHTIASMKAIKYDNIVGTKGNLWFTGHSLGGGLASAATISTKKRTGITFNAAGLNVMGVKINQLIHNPSHIIYPFLSWTRVTPYRIKGEVLDTAQKYAGYVLQTGGIPILERGYGINSVEYDISQNDVGCGARHGIINFLMKEVMNKLAPFESVRGDTGSTVYNKIINVLFESKIVAMDSSIA